METHQWRPAAAIFIENCMNQYIISDNKSHLIAKYYLTVYQR